MFKKREGTSGISGHLYETKLLSLLYFRAIHDKRILEFQLASNVDKVGAFDDICFKAKVDGVDKPVFVFIQAKHRENKKQTLKIDFATYFISYLEVRQQFDPSSNDLFFKGSFDEAECLFVIYTTARDELTNDTKVGSGFFSILNDLIDTGGTAKQTYKQEDDVDLLCKVAMKEQISSLAQRIAKFINDDGDFQMLLTDEIVLRYHVLLAQKVVEVSELEPAGHRFASFRNNFFDTNEDYLVIFKGKLFKEILKNRKIKTSNMEKFMSEFLAEPTDVAKLSNLIGTVITYNNGQLEFDEKVKKYLESNMKPIYMSRSTVNKAIERAAKDILLSQKFKVPGAFGNKDITLSGNDEKKKKRIKYLTTKITDLLDMCKTSKEVTVDESLGEGFLQLNGGIGSAIGNIFVPDGDSKLMKITDNKDSLGTLAKNLFESLNEEIDSINKARSENKIPNLCEYKFSFVFQKVSKLLLRCTEYEEMLARDFLNKLLIYSHQADEKNVERILKSEVEEYPQDQPNYFQVHSDAIFSKYHTDIQNWWMLPDQASYLTRESDLFQNARNNIIKDPLLSIINVMYWNSIKHIDYTFTEDAVTSLNFQDQHSSTVIITDNSILTIFKVMQHLKNKNPVVLDLKYIVKLPQKDRKLLHKEIKDTKEGKVLILLCDDIPNDKKKILENIAEAVLNKKTIVVTNHASLDILKKSFPNPPVYDENNNLTNMSEESQKSILERGKVLFQGTEVRLNLIVVDEAKTYVKGDVLNKIISEESIAVGKLTVSRNYEEIKHLYFDRRVRKPGPVTDKTLEKSLLLKTLYDIEDDVVIVTAEPGMGKTTLLTHLSIKTKEFKPEVWIVRIDLLECSEEFSKWKTNETVIDLLEILKFMCQVMLREKFGKDNKVEIKLEEKDKVVYLKHCTADPLTEFELNLFVHFYCEREMIFLFDGFDEICPHYADVVIKCLKTISHDSRKHRMWITSRSYNEVKAILEKEFQSSYELDYFSKMDMKKYLQTFWEFNLRLEELNSRQLDNVKKFLDHMSTVNNERSPVAKSLYAIFKSAAVYMNSELKNTHIPLWKYNNDDTSSSSSSCRAVDIGDIFQDKLIFDANPLIMYLTAINIQHHIKNDTTMSDGWCLDIDTYTVFEKFLENKIKIRYQEKNGMKICNPDIVIAYEKEVADSILKHKKLGAYAIFNEYSFIFSAKDLEDLKEMMRFVEKGEEKTGLINSVANGIPIFIHKTFAEYFAVEYICDCLKNKCVAEKFRYFIAMFELRFKSVRKIFDHKIKTDKTLVSFTKTHKDDIINWLMRQVHVDGIHDVLVSAILTSKYEDLSITESFHDSIFDIENNNRYDTILQNDELCKLCYFFLYVQYPNLHLNPL